MTSLVRLARGCYLSSDVSHDLKARCHAALAVCDGDTVLSSTTAARLYGLWLPRLPDELHLASAQPGIPGRHMRRTQRPEFIAHRRQLPHEDRCVLDGLAAMTPARTWLDLAPLLSLPDLVAAGDSVLRLGATVDELAHLVRSNGRQRGIRRARAAVGLLDGRSRSRGESHLRVAISVDYLPRFEVNVAVHHDGGRGWLAEPDLSLAEAKIALEYQGADHAEPRRMRRDITRVTDLRRANWLCIEYGPAEVFGRPWEIAPELHDHIRSRAPRLFVPRSGRRVARHFTSSG